jgi:hypothetical protein
MKHIKIIYNLEFYITSMEVQIMIEINTYQSINIESRHISLLWNDHDTILVETRRRSAHTCAIS